jgi:sugar/nucleoside kinase (ribokinase family)
LILLDATGEKTIATRRGVNLNNVLPKDPAGLVADASAVLVDNRFPEFVTAVCRAAQGRKIPIVIDLDQATKLDDPLLALGTHVVASTEALFGMTGSDNYEDALKALSTHLSSFVAITDGPKGVYWLDGGELRHPPAFNVDVITRWRRRRLPWRLHAGTGRRPLPDILRFASATAALKCTKFGGASGAPMRADVEAFLKQRS